MTFEKLCRQPKIAQRRTSNRVLILALREFEANKDTDSEAECSRNLFDVWKTGNVIVRRG